MPEGVLSNCVGRACQLGYSTNIAETIAKVLFEFSVQRKLCVVRWDDLEPLTRLPQVSMDSEYIDEDDDWEEDFSDLNEKLPLLSEECLLASPMLLDSLHRASSQKAEALYVLAVIYRCKKPNPYLYEESLKGRLLNATEQLMASNYLLNKCKYPLYEKYLKAAAESGVRQAALEYGTAFEQLEFIALAERLDGDVNALHMARVVRSEQAQQIWLRKAAEQGSLRALEDLACRGNQWAEDRLAASAKAYWIRLAADRALASGNVIRAWSLQYVSLEFKLDLTCSTLVARHAEGINTGQRYDDDIGGPIYVDGDDGLMLPEINYAEHEDAKLCAFNIMSSLI